MSTFNGLKVPREVADRFIQQELGYKPKIDTTKVYEDAEGNPLTKEQVEFYKDSDVRDIRGRLIPVYHRTNAEFTVFDKKAGKQHGNKYGKGFYFSITPENYGNNEMKVYLNAKEGEYKYIPSQGYYVVQEANQIKNVDNTNPTDSSDIRYSLSVKEANTGVDNQGEEVKPGMQKYMADSKATDENGNIIRVYHTTTDEIPQFNEFNPVGTPYYRFGDQVVNYYTNSKDMSGSYASQKYVMADTTKLNSIEEANQYFKEKLKDLNKYRQSWGDRELRIELARNDAINKNKPFSFVTEEKNPYTGEWFETDVDSFETLEKALKNANKIIQRRSPANKIQYEGYVNITNPYIVDAEKRNWNQVIQQSNEFIDELEERVPQDIKDNLTRLYQESANKSAEARDNYNVLENVISQGINGYLSSVDENIKKVNDVVKEVGFSEIEQMLKGESPGVSAWYNIADSLERNGLIGSATKTFII